MEVIEFNPSPEFMSSSAPLINVIKSKTVKLAATSLRKPIDQFLSDKLKKRLFGFCRFKDNEILLPKHVFVTLGLSQPAWVLVD